MQAARLMTLHAAWRMDTEGASAARTDISLIKFFGAEVLHDVVDRALQIHGALGYSTDMPLEAMYRYARAARFYDGADEVHRQSVARQILRGYEPPADGVPQRACPDPPRGGARAVRRPARGGHRQRLSRAPRGLSSCCPAARRLRGRRSCGAQRWPSSARGGDGEPTARDAPARRGRR